MNNPPPCLPLQNGMPFPLHLLQQPNVASPQPIQRNVAQPISLRPQDWANQPHLFPHLMGNPGSRIQHSVAHPMSIRQPTQRDRESIALVCASLLSKAFNERKQQKETEEDLRYPYRISRPLPPIGGRCEGLEDKDDEMPLALPFPHYKQLKIRIPQNPSVLMNNDDLLAIATPSHSLTDDSSTPTNRGNRLNEEMDAHEISANEEADQEIIFVCEKKGQKKAPIIHDDKDDDSDEDSSPSPSPPPKKSNEASTSTSHKDTTANSGFEFRRRCALAASSQIRRTLKEEGEKEKEEKEEIRIEKKKKRLMASAIRKQATMAEKAKKMKKEKPEKMQANPTNESNEREEDEEMRDDEAETIAINETRANGRDEMEVEKRGEEKDDNHEDPEAEDVDIMD